MTAIEKKPTTGKARAVEHALALLAKAYTAKRAAGFFKTGPGTYAEGDVFIGVTVPQQRAVAREFSMLPLPEVAKLLQSPIHEHRLTALLILTVHYGALTKLRPGPNQKNSLFHGRGKVSKKELVDFYLKNVTHINNWDLVDVSAPRILGAWCLENADTKKLYVLAKSKNLWARRIAIVATYALIKEGKLDDTFHLAETLLNDTHDLIHKAVGWMLREAGKKDTQRLRAFLAAHTARMPRTTLRYAIERMDERERATWMKKPVKRTS